MTHRTTPPVTCSSLPRQEFVVEFTAGQLTSDAGLVLLREADRQIKLLDAVAYSRSAAIPLRRPHRSLDHADAGTDPSHDHNPRSPNNSNEPTRSAPQPGTDPERPTPTNRAICCHRLAGIPVRSANVTRSVCSKLFVPPKPPFVEIKPRLPFRNVCQTKILYRDGVREH
jgi:hypothetical protein